jgi:hypothetical protein
MRPIVLLNWPVRPMVCRLCLLMRWRLPMFVRSYYILSVYRNAKRHYAP